jgi:hypothetical protein
MVTVFATPLFSNPTLGSDAGDGGQALPPGKAPQVPQDCGVGNRPAFADWSACCRLDCGF